MLQAISTTPTVTMDRPKRFIQPRRPFVWTFALQDTPVLTDRIIPGEVTVIAVADGTRPTYDPGDWFAARVTATPPVTGPLYVSGVHRGDLLEIEVLALEPEVQGEIHPLRVTLTGSPMQGADPMQVVVPAGSMVRLRAGRGGGLLSVGPVLAAMDGSTAGVPIGARVAIRCAVVFDRVR